MVLKLYCVGGAAQAICIYIAAMKKKQSASAATCTVLAPNRQKNAVFGHFLGHTACYAYTKHNKNDPQSMLITMIRHHVTVT